MGNNISTLKKQIIYYYLFHKHLENILQFVKNQLSLLKCANGNHKREKLYIFNYFFIFFLYLIFILLNIIIINIYFIKVDFIHIIFTISFPFFN